MRDLFEKLNESLRVITSDSEKNDFGDWDDRSINELKKIADLDENIVIKEKIFNFIGIVVYLADSTTINIKGFYSNSWWFSVLHKIFILTSGVRRGGIREAKLNFHVLEKNNKLDLLRKHPMPNTGNPSKISYKGFQFTNRYLRHIFFLSIFNEYIRGCLSSSPVVLDIGSGYGTFQSLIKKELPDSKHILVDIAGQLLLAQYYLQTEFPDSKIASIADVNAQEQITQEFIENFDFILIPANQYDKLCVHHIDLTVNFVSFVEMPKEWFDRYMNSAPFKNADYFYTINRYDSYPTYSSGTTILDFSLDKYETLFFRTLPILRYYYTSWLFVFSVKERYSSDLFQFIGRNNRLTDKG
jgi:putative sugar O-methyltransferase